MFWKRPRKTVDFFAEKQFLLPKTEFRAGENRFFSTQPGEKRKERMPD